jgi:hypothetical protein
VRNVQTNVLSNPNAQIARFNPNDRRHFIGGSDARVIMGNDEDDLVRLWGEKRGEIEPQDFSRNLIVQLGTITEELNRSWYQRCTGQTITDVQKRARHPINKWMAATLDGVVEQTGAVFEAKFMLPFGLYRESRRRLVEYFLLPSLSCAAPLSAEISPQDIRIPHNTDGIFLRDNPAGFEHVCTARNRERAVDVLLDDQDSDALLPQVPQGAEHLLRHQWAKPKAWLVEQQKLRGRHERSANRQHLLLAAGQKSINASSPARATSRYTRSLASFVRSAPPCPRACLKALSAMIKRSRHWQATSPSFQAVAPPQ